MALVDFYQLAVLFNLRRRDAQFLSERSYPPMSTPAPPNRIHSSLPHHNFAVPSTPPHRRDPSTVLGLTPVSRGAAIRRGQEGDTDRVDKYARADYEDYIREDLGCRVFVDYEVFMKQVLHVPDDWKTRWRPAIDAVKADGEFDRHHKQYCDMCNEGMTPEKAFYSPLMETANAVLEVVSRSNFNHIPSERRQYYCVSDPNHLRGGVMSKKNLCPDIVLLHKNRTPPKDTKEKLVYWANPLHVLEVKPYDNVICDGAHMPHLIVDGEHARWCFRSWLQLIWRQALTRPRRTQRLPRSGDTATSSEILPRHPRHPLRRTPGRGLNRS